MRRAEPGGFTLVELLVALVLFGMFSVALFAELRGGAGTLDRVAANSAGTNGLAAAYAVLRRNFLAAYPLYESGERAVAFAGDSDGVAFLAPAPAALAPGGFSRVAVGVVGKNLVIAARPELAWAAASGESREVLAADVLGVRFGYFGADAAGGAAYWHGSWRNRAVLPLLVRVSVAFPAGDFRRWPELIFATAVRADQGCQFVQLTQSCLGR